jgi:transposase
MTECIKYVGLDVHKSTIAVAIAESGSSEVRYFGEIPNTPEQISKTLRKLGGSGTELSVCYEAGPCGYEVYRQLSSQGIDCMVVAPSMIPRKAGDRVKTDRRDSQMLARLHRAGELTSVWVPSAEQEALRDLVRGRADFVLLQTQSRQRLNAFLLRHGKRFDGKSKWTLSHFRWLETIKCDFPSQQIVLQEYIDTVLHMQNRIKALDKQIELAGNESTLWPLIQNYMALRGVSRLVATALAAELGDITRFANAPHLMAYLGLVPSEHSSGLSKVRGGITKTGNGYVRRLLTEAAWTYRHMARKSACLQRRAEQTPEPIQEIAWKAQQRLCARYRGYIQRGKVSVQACTAVARELVGFIWAIGQATGPLHEMSANA